MFFYNTLIYRESIFHYIPGVLWGDSLGQLPRKPEMGCRDEPVPET